jgi:anti-sigma B factor antagonist
MASEQHDIADGTLEVRTAIEDGTRVVSLSGELDLSNAETAETALQEALAADAPLIVDMRELEFIDSTGIALLVGIIGGERPGVRFVPSGSAAVTRVMELTGLAGRLPLVEAE